MLLDRNEVCWNYWQVENILRIKAGVICIYLDAARVQVSLLGYYNCFTTWLVSCGIVETRGSYVLSPQEIRQVSHKRSDEFLKVIKPSFFSFETPLRRVLLVSNLFPTLGLVFTVQLPTGFFCKHVLNLVPGPVSEGGSFCTLENDKLRPFLDSFPQTYNTGDYSGGVGLLVAAVVFTWHDEAKTALNRKRNHRYARRNATTTAKIQKHATVLQKIILEKS